MSNLFTEITTVFEEARLPRTFCHGFRRTAEFLAPDFNGKCVPVEFVLVERNGNTRGIDSTLAQFRRYAPRTISASSPRSGISLGITTVILQPFCCQVDQSFADCVSSQAFARELLLEFARAVFASGKRVNGAIARAALGPFLAQASASNEVSSVSSSATPVERGIAITRMAASSS